MILEKDHATVARWSTDKWIVEARPRYRWTDIKGRVISNWFDQFELALEFAVESGTRLGATGTRNQN